MQHSSFIIGCPPAKSTPTMCSGLPSQRKTKAQERTAAFVKYHWQPSIPSERGICSKLKKKKKTCDRKLEALRIQQASRALSGRQYTAGSKLYSNHLNPVVKWAKMVVWLSTTKARFILAPTVYELRRWKRVIKCCPGQLQCVREKESIL